MPQVVVAALTIFGNAVVAVGAIGTAMGFGIGVGALAAGACCGHWRRYGRQKSNVAF